MDNLLGVLGVKEYTSDFNKEFLLKNNENFSDEEMQKMEMYMGKNCIVSNKVLFNGKIKLIYITERYRTLASVLNQLEKKSFAKCLLQVLQCQCKIENSKKLDIRKLLLDKRYIFWEMESEQIKMIYLPVRNVSISEEEAKCRVREFLKWMVESVTILDSRIETDLLSEITKQSMTSNEIHENIFDIFNNSTKLGIDATKKEESYEKEEAPKQEKVKHSTKTLILQMKGSKQPLLFRVYKKEFVIGRNAKISDGVITGNNKIGRQHCKILFSQNKYFLIDLNSKNGTFLNGKKISENMNKEIAENDIIRLANVDFVAKFVE